MATAQITGATATGGPVTTTNISSFTPEQQAAFGAAAKLAPTGSVQTSGGPVQGPQPITPATPVPTAPPAVPKPTTAISSDQGAQYASENSQTLETLKSTGLTVGADGLARYSDSSFAPAPSTAVQGEDGTWQSGGVKYAIGPATAVNPEHQAVLDQIASMKTQFDNTSRAMIQNIQDQFSRLIAQQTDVNTRGQASLGQSLLMGGSSRYAPISSGGQMTAMMSYGLDQIADLNTKEQTAVLNAQQAMDSGDMKFMDESLTEAQKARDDKQKAAQSLSDKLVKANQDLQTQKKGAAMSASISSLMAEGITDPAKILNALQKNGDTTTTADDVAKAVKDLTPASSTGDTFKFSQTQASQMYAAGLTPADVKTLQDYYNGNGDPSLVSNLTPEHYNALMSALNGTAAKKAASTVPSYAELNPKGTTTSSGYTSGSLSFDNNLLGAIQDKLLYKIDPTTGKKTTAKGADGYIDPYVYQKALEAWTQDGGLAKDFIKNFPVKNYINPTASFMPAYIASKLGKSTSSGRSI